MWTARTSLGDPSLDVRTSVLAAGQDWSTLGQQLRDRYRANERSRGPSMIWRRCRGRDEWFQIVVPFFMVFYALVVKPLGLLNFLGRLAVHFCGVASDCAVDPMFSDICALFAVWVDGAFVDAKNAVQPKASRPISPTLQLAMMAVLRATTDAGWFYPAKPRKDVLVPPTSALGLQGSSLSLAAVFVLGQSATFVSRNVCDAVWMALLLVARLSGLARVATRLGRCDEHHSCLSTTVRAGTAAATALTAVTSTTAGFVVLLPLAHAADNIARFLDDLTQQAQRLQTPLFQLALRHSWHCCVCCRRFWGEHKRRLETDSWQWQVPETVVVPHELCCPITWQLLVQPVILHGDVFERSALEWWLRSSARHPLRSDVAVHGDEVRRAEGMEAVCHAFAEQRHLSVAPL